MRINRLNSRNIIVSFPELDQTNVLVIYGKKYTYICDTFLGPDSMEPIKKMIADDNREQPFIIFNSHHDWDHVWGNCAFIDSIVIAHYKCRELLEKNFHKKLEKYNKYAKGNVFPCYPNLLFSEKIIFFDDGVEFFYSPGHTEDSSSCFDRQTRALFAGDNIEFPLPFIQNKDLGKYISTLNKYIDINPETIITGHGKEGSIDLLVSNLDYLEKLYKSKEVIQPDWNQEKIERHEVNIRKLNNELI